MHKFLLILVLKQKNYSCLSKVKKIGAVFLRFMMMHEQIENISLRIRWKWDPKFYLPASTMASAPPADNFRTSWSIEQRTFCVQRHQHHNSFKLLETEFKTKFQCGKSPSKSVIQRWLNNFSLYGSVRNQNSKSAHKEPHSGRPTKRVSDVVAAVRNSVTESPKKSLRKRAQSLGLNSSTCWRVLRADAEVSADDECWHSS